MSILSGLIGKVPLVGGLINDVGKVLPSGGQMIGGAALGPIGALIGGSIDGNTTPVQKDIGGAVAGAAGALGGGALLGGALGAIPGASSVESALSNIPGASEILNAVKSGAPGAIESLLGLLKNHAGDLMTAANVYEAAQRQGKADKFANQAINTATDAYNAKAPLRMAGLQGMLNPQTPDLSNLRSLAGSRSGNPFARTLPMAGGAPSPVAPPVTQPRLAMPV